MNKQFQSPRILEFILRQILPFKDQENLLGDFEEMFNRISAQKGRVSALVWYIYTIIKLIPTYFRNYTYWSVTMITSYLKIALRNMKKYKAYSFINIFGLALGMACCLLILLYIQDELSYDQYHQKSDRIYRVVDSFNVPGGGNRDVALTSAPIGPTLKKDFPEVEDAARIFPRRRMVTYKNKKFYEDDLVFADGSIFNIFTFPFLKGNPKTALLVPRSIVISKGIAKKYFGNEEALNKTLRIQNQDFSVTGVMEDMPNNSHFRASIFVSLKTLEQIPSLQKPFFQNWVRHEFYTYILLKEGYSPQDLESKLPGFMDKYAAQQVKSILGGTISSRLQPLKKIYLHSQLQAEIRSNSDIKYVYIFSLIAFFILLIACINFINLATAQSFNRSKEVGLRKVVGANRLQLINQFLGESLLFTIIALLVAYILISIALPFFNLLTSKDISIYRSNNLFLLAFTILILLFAGLTSGSYPSFFISRYQPVNVLKRHLARESQRALLRKALVILQFGISIILIIGTIVILDQLDFMRNRRLGFQKENVVIVPIRTSSIRTNAEAIKAQIQHNPNITTATISIGVPGGIVAGDAINLITQQGTQTITVRMIYTDHDYIKTMGMEMVEGRDFSKEMITDAKQAFIINEAAVRELQLKNPLETMFEWGGPDYGITKKGKVIGVVKDFQFQSLKSEITPLIIHIHPSSTRVFAIKIRSNNIAETLAFIKNKWEKLDPAHPFEYSFMNETIDRLYSSEEKLSQIFTIFSILAMLIAVLGLFGLVLFVVTQRTKEISIRKVLGASIGDIFVLVSGEFVRLVLIANIFAWPMAYFLMDNWLQDFNYRVNIGIWMFFISALLVFIIALLTISVQVIRAAISDPINSLKYE